MLSFLRKILPGKHEKDIQAIRPVVEEINAYLAELRTLSDEELRGKTAVFRSIINERSAELEANLTKLKEDLKSFELTPEQRQDLRDQVDAAEKELDDAIEDVLGEILPEAFAVVKETCRRLLGTTWDVTGHKIVWDMVPFDVQLLGAVVLHDGKIAEMATGEGKTLVATLPMYLNALPGRGVHLVTVNDYLARRDSEWMGRIFEFLGLSVGCIQSQMEPLERRKNYACDITYGTNNEFGFDYLRDNMVITKDDMVQRGHNYAIVDEVDSVLVDEARTPLIISGPVGADDQKFDEMKPRVERLVKAQTTFVAKILADAEALLAQGKEDGAGVLLLRGQHGAPKNKKLLKLLAEGPNKQLMQKTEMEYLREQGKRLHEIDDELYYNIEEKTHDVNLSEKGREMLASMTGEKEMFVLPDLGTELSLLEHQDGLTPAQVQEKKDALYQLYAERSDRIHTVAQLLKAYSLYEKDVEYVVTDDGKIQIVDEFTGRLLPGRRYSEGLHQAIEAKEGVKVERDTQTLATVTLQNYFRLYKKLAGMTGTAETEASELMDIYKLDVVVVPTNKPCVRTDHDDLVYRTRREKYNAVMDEIEEMRKIGRPVLVGTTSVEVSETLSRMLKRKGVAHNVLNAKQHQREAEIVQNAGLPGVITIATNMAGRGTDIKLGPGVAEAGGLHIVGTERHEARRIDRQLRGRAGRQGDPGSSRFYLSLEDDLMRLFGSERIAGILERFGLKEGEPITHPMITRSVERAQKKVEENNFSIRKRLLEYDNVMNRQREVIYAMRRHALLGDRLSDEMGDMLEEYTAELVEKYYDAGDIEGLREELRRNIIVDVEITPDQWMKAGKDGVRALVVNAAHDFYKRKEEKVGSETMGMIERMALLQVIDERWKEHLREMDDLKEGIGLRAYGQKDPLLEYKQEAFGMFSEMMAMINREALGFAFKLYPQVAEALPQPRARRAPRREEVSYSHEESLGMGYRRGKEPDQAAAEGARPPKRAPVKVEMKIGRNEPCPCGSGKKYKQCHGRGQ